MIYFDNAATSLIKPEGVYNAVNYAMRIYGNPGRGGHMFSTDASECMFNCREKIGKLFNYTDTENIVFTSNATHGLNIAINSLVNRGDSVLVSGFEHNAVMRPLCAKNPHISVYGNKLFDAEYTIKSLKQKIRKNTKCVILNHISNVFGFIQPIYEIAAICDRFGKPLIVDCSQSAGVIDIDLSKIRPAFAAMPGHKSLLGPQGTGVLICGRTPKPLIYGGTGSLSAKPNMPDFLPDMLEAGTVNMPGIAGLSAGIDFLLSKNPGEIIEHEETLVRILKENLADIDSLETYFSNDELLQSGVVSVASEIFGCEELSELLNLNNVAVRAGLHCAPLAHKSAGTFEKGTVRISFGCFNTEEEIKEFCMILKGIVKEK